MIEDDIVIRLRQRTVDPHPNLLSYAQLMGEAATEIERLRTALALAVGELSTHSEHAVESPDMLMLQFMAEASNG